MVESQLQNIKILLVKVRLKIGQEKYLLLILLQKTMNFITSWTYKVKELNGELIIGRFYERINK